MPKRQSAIKLKRAATWAPRQDIAPKTHHDRGDFIVTGNGSAGCYGGYHLIYAAPKPGTWAHFSVNATWRALEGEYDAVACIITWHDARGEQVGWEPLLPVRATKEYVTYAGRLRVSENAVTMTARLYITWSAQGEIRWSDPQLKRIPAPRPRRMRLGAAGGALPPGKHTVAGNTRYALGLCELAARQHVDLLCLPEIVLQWGLPDGQAHASRLPGKHLAPFMNFAREHKMALCFSVIEKARELYYNTAVLINRKGVLVGTYRKVYLAPPSEMWDGTTAGHEFPVYDIGGAKVGMNICMDSSAAEAARTPARLGAEVICMPIMGDFRASSYMDGSKLHEFDINRWQQIQCVRAMDNQVWMLVSRNLGVGCGIFGPDGKVLALSGGGCLVHAEVDLEDLPRTGQDSTYRAVIWHQYRAPRYNILPHGLPMHPFGE